MSTNTRRRWVAGMILGLGSAGPSAAQEIPPALPPLPGEPLGSQATAPSPMFIARPLPPIVEVPPEGVRPTWAPGPLDPIALQRHQAPHVDRKSRSWKWRRTQGKFWGYPEEFEPRPLGSSIYETNKIMVANGALARLVLYNYDFLPGTSELSPRGIDQLDRFVPQLAASPFPLIVERTTPDLALSESRRYAVLARLARGLARSPRTGSWWASRSPTGCRGSMLTSSATTPSSGPSSTARRSRSTTAA